MSDNFTFKEDIVSNMTIDALEEVLAEIFDTEETPEDRWREFLS